MKCGNLKIIFSEANSLSIILGFDKKNECVPMKDSASNVIPVDKTTDFHILEHILQITYKCCQRKDNAAR